MPNKKKPSFADEGYEIVSGYRIRKMETKSGSRYQVDLGRVSGKHVRKNFTDAKKARSYATQARVKATDVGIKALRFTDRQRNDAVEALEVLHPFNATLRDAAHYFAKHHKEVDRTNGVGALVDQYIEEKEQLVKRNELRPASLADTTYFVKQFAAQFGHLAIDTITPGEIDEFLDNVNGEANRRSHRLYISAFCNWAVGKDRLSVNPVKKTRSIPKKTKTPEIYSPADVKEIMQKAPPKLIPYLALGMFGGIRPAEILRLRWADVDFELHEIRITADQSKTSMGRIVHMQPNLVQFLAPYKGDPKELVVPHEQKNLQRWARVLYKKLEIKAIHQGARHSFATYHLALHPLDETMQELGHTESATLFKHYRGLASNRKEQAKKYFDIRPPQGLIEFPKSERGVA